MGRLNRNENAVARKDRKRAIIRGLYTKYLDSIHARATYQDVLNAGGQRLDSTQLRIEAFKLSFKSDDTAHSARPDAACSKFGSFGEYGNQVNVTPLSQIRTATAMVPKGVDVTHTLRTAPRIHIGGSHISE